MATVRLDIEYDGTDFSGWARQPGQRTVQEELETALATVLAGAAADLTVAGRTDSGVHALGQVASFSVDSPLPVDLARAVNSVGPDDITVTAAAEAADGFDARADATSRAYRYRVLKTPAPRPFERGRALWWPHPVDAALLEDCATSLRGTHDFTAFTPTQTDHVHFDRDILSANWEHRDAIASFHITADAFMRSMVRVLVGTMLEVASSRRSLEDFRELLDGAPRSAAGETAPPHGLYLESVSYDRAEPLVS